VPCGHTFTVLRMGVGVRADNMFDVGNELQDGVNYRTCGGRCWRWPRLVVHSPYRALAKLVKVRY
jgi:hypothetical protein